MDIVGRRKTAGSGRRAVICWLVKYRTTARATKESRGFARFHHSYSKHINRRVQDIGVAATTTRRLVADDEIGGNVFMEMML